MTVKVIGRCGRKAPPSFLFLASGMEARRAETRVTAPFPTGPEGRRTVPRKAHMSEFEEIRRLYKTRCDEHFAYRQIAAQFALRFATGFREHIGAPEDYVGLDGNTRTAYVEPTKITQTPFGQAQSARPQNHLDLVTFDDDDGYFRFGVRLALEAAADAFPKQPFVFVLRFAIDARQCELEAVGEAFSFDINDNNALTAAYAAMSDALKRELSRKPWDGIERPIGFLPLSRD